ncbi:MAG: HEAT repeat domain-containing protein [Pirellulaceae bacterium]
MVGFLDHEDASLRDEASESLQELGPAAAQAVDKLHQMLTMDPKSYVQQSVAYALGAIGAPAAVAADDLAAKLASEDEYDRSSAIAALTHIPWSSESAWNKILAYRDQQMAEGSLNVDQFIEVLGGYAGDFANVQPLFDEYLNSEARESPSP